MVVLNLTLPKQRNVPGNSHADAELCPVRCAGFVNENKQFPRQQFAFVVDGLSTVAGSLMGTSPISTCADLSPQACALQTVLLLF